MKRYEKYKPSGIEWIGEIPAHWEVKKLGWLGKFSASGIDKKIVKGEPLVKMINYTDIYGNKKLTLTANRKYMIVSSPAEKKIEHQVNVGDLIFTPSSETVDEIGLSAVVIDELPDTVYSYHVIRLRFNKELNLGFKKYLCNNNFVLNQFSKKAKGTTRQIIGRDVFKNILVIIPPLEEQTAIADYLDRKTAQIDELIAGKKRLLELYEEEKTAIINQAVTKGINPDVPMKDSSIEWIGEIPEHWEVKKLNSMCRFVRGNSNFKKDELLDNGKYIALQYGKTYKVNEIDKKYEYYVNDEFYKISQVVKLGDVILISTSETIDDLGHSVFYNRKDMGLLGGEQILLRPNCDIVNDKYLYYSSKVFTKELRKYATGIKVFRFNISDLKKIYIPVPPLEEQTAIVKYIEKEIARINTKVEKTKKLIELLEEYKQALISEVVTGKIKVV